MMLIIYALPNEKDIHQFLLDKMDIFNFIFKDVASNMYGFIKEIIPLRVSPLVSMFHFIFCPSSLWCP